MEPRHPGESGRALEEERAVIVSGSTGKKPRDSDGFIVHDEYLCLECIVKKLGFQPGSLTWEFKCCPVCDLIRICTKTKHILQLRAKP